MKKDWKHLEKYRFQSPPYISPVGAKYGAFRIPYEGVLLCCIASDAMDGIEWEHVSIHAREQVFKKQRTPKWSEMSFVASQFWEPDECLVQFRPPEVDYVNIHDHVLHWWKAKNIEFPRPPKICV